LQEGKNTLSVASEGIEGAMTTNALDGIQSSLTRRGINRPHLTWVENPRLNSIVANATGKRFIHVSRVMKTHG
jgi:hypothetical protein